MKQRKKVEWTRLDNASKIFPATINNTDTKVFRMVCELIEKVDPFILQKALDASIKDFPFYRSVLRKGVFWYYFETSEIDPIIELESRPICAPIYHKDKKNLLFRVSYFNERINLEIFHALSDGTGALWFMQNLVSHYLFFSHKEDFANKRPKFNHSASISEKMNDSFNRHFVGDVVHQLQNKKNPAYQINGSKMDENRMNLIEGTLSANALLEEAHKYNTTLTIYVTSLFIYSIYKGMPARKKNHPVVLSIPINLRQFFESETVRNFFSTFFVGYRFSNEKSDLKDIIRRVEESFSKELTPEKLHNHLNRLMSLEINPFARIIPLPLKDLSLRMANKLNDKKITAAISNIGRIAMPSEFSAYIKQFCLSTSARRPQICMCSYGDRLVITFTSPFKETEIQRTFFRFLTTNDIEIEISSNL